MITPSSSPDPQYFRPYRSGAWHVCKDFTSRRVWAVCGKRVFMMDTEWAIEPPRHWRMCEECRVCVEDAEAQGRAA